MVLMPFEVTLRSNNQMVTFSETEISRFFVSKSQLLLTDRILSEWEKTIIWKTIIFKNNAKMAVKSSKNFMQTLKSIKSRIIESATEQDPTESPTELEKDDSFIPVRVNN